MRLYLDLRVLMFVYACTNVCVCECVCAFVLYLIICFVRDKLTNLLFSL